MPSYDLQLSEQQLAILLSLVIGPIPLTDGRTPQVPQGDIELLRMLGFIAAENDVLTLAPAGLGHLKFLVNSKETPIGLKFSSRLLH